MYHRSAHFCPHWPTYYLLYLAGKLTLKSVSGSGLAQSWRSVSLALLNSSTFRSRNTFIHSFIQSTRLIDSVTNFLHLSLPTYTAPHTMISSLGCVLLRLDDSSSWCLTSVYMSLSMYGAKFNYLLPFSDQVRSKQNKLFRSMVKASLARLKVCKVVIICSSRFFVQPSSLINTIFFRWLQSRKCKRNPLLEVWGVLTVSLF